MPKIYTKTKGKQELHVHFAQQKNTFLAEVKHLSFTSNGVRMNFELTMATM